MNSTAIATILSALANAGALPADIAKVQAFIQNAVQLAESTAAADEAKLQAVLDATQTFVMTAMPQLKVDWGNLQTEAKAFVSALVTLWEGLGVFAKDVAGDVKSGVAALEKAI